MTTLFHSDVVLPLSGGVNLNPPKRPEEFRETFPKLGDVTIPWEEYQELLRKAHKAE